MERHGQRVVGIGVVGIESAGPTGGSRRTRGAAPLSREGAGKGDTDMGVILPKLPGLLDGDISIGVTPGRIQG
jgi:hypothetical protein